jgi:hypothetical protein
MNLIAETAKTDQWFPTIKSLCTISPSRQSETGQSIPESVPPAGKPDLIMYEVTVFCEVTCSQYELISSQNKLHE